MHWYSFDPTEAPSFGINTRAVVTLYVHDYAVWKAGVAARVKVSHSSQLHVTWGPEEITSGQGGPHSARPSLGTGLGPSSTSGQRFERPRASGSVKDDVVNATPKLGIAQLPSLGVQHLEHLKEQ
jgi:hypothetical protein